MGLDPISAVADLANGIIERIWPDATEAEKAKVALAQMVQNGELAKMTAEVGLIQGQIDVDKVEAANPSLFVAGWRPFIGWLCGGILGLVYIPKTLALTGIWVYVCIKHGNMEPFPDLGVTDVLGLLGAMLGIGGMRTLEKIQGVATAAMSKTRK